MKTKKDLLFYLAADRFALGRQGSPKLFGDEIWKFQIALRKCEYYKTKSAPFRPLYLFWKIRNRQLGLKLGFEIPEFVFGAGLRINHYGNLIVNRESIVGRWCDIHQGVNIGSSNPVHRIPTERYSPTIGDNAWIGPGAKIYGNITIGQRVQIGANAVVGKSCGDDVTIGGVPAKIIRQSGTAAVDVAANPNRAEEFFKLHPEFKSYQKHSPYENPP